MFSFLVALLFFRQHQRISDKERDFMDAVSMQVISERADGKCFSSEWVMDNIVYKPKKLLSATPLFAATLVFLLTVFFFGVGPKFLASIVGFGYATLIVLIGIAVIFWTDAFEAYNYANAIRTVSTEQLDKEDKGYIELAREALEKAFLRFVSLGIAFSLIGPFIPQVFNTVVYVFILYSTVFFRASEMSFQVLTLFGALVVIILPALMLFLPEFLARILIRKGKSFARKLFKRGVEQ